jgi:ribosomal protein S18 acetylase RimI-like enzyme
MGQRLDLRLVKREEAYLIEQLFQTVYNKPQGEGYWDWMFETPNGYIPAGMFDNGKLIAFYSAVMLDNNHAVCYSAKVDPDYRGFRMIQFVAQKVYDEVKARGGKYVYLFANKNIRNIYKKHLGFQEACQIKEYNLDYVPGQVDQFKFYYPLYQTEWVQWRYAQHPLHQETNTRYMYYYDPESEKYLAFSTYKDRVQLMDYVDLNDGLSIAMLIVMLLEKCCIHFWSEEDLDYGSECLPVWKMYKMLDDNIDWMII